MEQAKNRLMRKVLIALLSVFFVFGASMALFMSNTNTVHAASEKVAEFHFYEIGTGSGTRTDNGVGFAYSGIKANSYSNITIGGNSSVTITVSESNINSKGITSGAFCIYASGISYTWKRGSTTLSSGNISYSVQVGETSIAGSGNLVLTLTNSSSSDVSDVHFENPNYALYAAEKRSVTITKGTGVNSVYLSTSSTATSGSTSGTEYADGTKVYGFATIADGYNPQSGWTLVSGKTYCVGSKTISKSQKDFGTVSAQLATYTISYTLNGGSVSGNPTSYNINTDTFTLSNPTKTGYNFAGWSGTGISGTSTSVSVAKGSTGNRSYTANWTAKTYTVTLDKNSGTGGSNSVTATFGSAMPSLTIPSKTGYTFRGYFDSSNVKYYNADGTSAKSWDKAAEATLTAQWQINQYPVSCPSGSDHATFFISSNSNATSGTTSGNFDYNSTVYFYVVADEGYYLPDGSDWVKIGYSGDRIIYRADSLTVGTSTNEFTAKEPERGDDIVASATGHEAPYDKSNHAISVTVATPASGYVIKYKVGSGAYSTTNPQYVNVCNVTVDYKITADGYYPLTGSATIVITRQQNVSYTTAPAVIEGLIYNANMQTLITAGTTNYGTVNYKIGESGEWATTLPKAQNVQEYVVYYCVPEDDNQVGIPASSFTVSIAEVDKDDLKAIVNTSNEYYNSIADTNPIIATTLLNSIHDAEDIRDNVNVTEGQVADATSTLEGKLSEAKIAVAIENINNIGEVEYTPDSKAKIVAARDAYDILSEEEKQLVINYQDLADAENLYYPVDDTVKAINDIGDLALDTRTNNAIIHARETYDDIISGNAGREAIFPADVYNALVDAEEAFRVMGVINAIGDVKYTDDSKALIEEARSVYDELTDEQKKLIPVSVFDALEAAEVSYENTEKSAKTVSTVINILLSLILAGGIVVLVLLLRKRKEYDKDGGTKLMSVSALPLFLAANHYFDARFIILYILAVLAVAVWVADLILFLKRREGNKKAETEIVAPVKEEKTEQDLPDESSIPEKAVIETATVMKGKDTTFNIRYIKSFTAKLIQSDDETKAFYGELKNAVLSYGNTTSKISWQYDSVYCGRKPVLKFGIRGKTLCVYFALDVKDLKTTKYKVELCESKKYALVPCMYRIKNAHRCELAKDLIAMAAEKFGLVKSKRQNVEYAFPYEDNAALLKKGLIKELKKRTDKKEAVVEKHHTVSVSEADAQMTDEVAATYIEDDLVSKTHKGKKGIINIDTIGDNFDDGDTVDIEALWEKNLIPKSVGYVKVLARGTLGKKLVIDLQDYSIQAVKMVILEGGTVKRAK